MKPAAINNRSNYFMPANRYSALHAYNSNPAELMEKKRQRRVHYYLVMGTFVVINVFYIL